MTDLMKPPAGLLNDTFALGHGVLARTRNACNVADIVGESMPPVELFEEAIARLNQARENNEPVEDGCEDSLLAACQVMVNASQAIREMLVFTQIVSPFYVNDVGAPETVTVEPGAEKDAFLLGLARSIRRSLLPPVVSSGIIRELIEELQQIESGYDNELCLSDMMGHVEAILGNYPIEVLAIFNAVAADMGIGASS